MLELKGIKKTYSVGGEDVLALKGIDLKFRKSEFVSVLGPSGCGKTTMLNIIGGLDHYSEGDLIINGTSTKQYKDRDWDAYRNHSIGFVFQSYNLIPHQTVLQNVELALTLSGVKKAERRKRAKEALEKVGLGSQLKKKPTEMSGGQMQRVAIARAIVNDPDIVLADEPTGALDTETSLQVMEILKEISKDRLVIMVTHNPDLAEKYSTRIVRMLDGLITSDSQPLGDEEIEEANREAEELKKTAKKVKMPSMSFATSFGLSLKNLFTKKGRTTLTSFAGSIGIIGIALIYAVSQGTTNYIDLVQEQTLTSYPITIQETSVDLGSLMTSFMGLAESTQEHENDAIYQKAMVYELINALTSVEANENDLASFKKHVEKEMSDPESNLSKAVSAIKYSYNLDFSVYTMGVDNEIIESNTTKLMMDLMSGMRGAAAQASSGQSTGASGASGTSSYMSQYSLWQELVPGNADSPISDVVKDQYDLLWGTWPEQYNEIVLFVDEHNELDDLTLYALGLKSKEDIQKIMTSALKKEEIEYEQEKWSYDEIGAIDFRTILPFDCYSSYDEKTGTYSDLRETASGLKYLYDNALKLKVVGIVKPNKDAVSASISSSIGYTCDLTEYIIKKAAESPVVKAQLANPDKDILTGLTFKDKKETENAKKAEAFRAYIEKLENDNEKAELYIKMVSIPSDQQVNDYVTQTLSTLTREQIEQMILASISGETGMDPEELKQYISNMPDEELNASVSEGIAEQFKEGYAKQVQAQMLQMTPEQLTFALGEYSKTLTEEQCAKYYDEIFEFSRATIDDNLALFGGLDIDSPSSVSIYTSTFANKDIIKDEIEKYNEGVEDIHKIDYTDIVGILMSSVTTIIDAITYVLIAFVSVSLIVSSIMIGVITLISVQERTKEIGILRAIGASKKNVSSMFNAETVIIGFTSGALGVLITYLLCIPINIILHSLTGIYTLSATLPPLFAIILVAISVLLTLIAGIIPSRSAARKDPVVALRTE